MRAFPWLPTRIRAKSGSSNPGLRRFGLPAILLLGNGVLSRRAPRPFEAGAYLRLLRRAGAKTGRRIPGPIRSWHLLLFLGVLLAYFGLVVPTLMRNGISWDEQTDLTIARAYLRAPHGWLSIIDLDPSQTRLPMFLTALIFRLAGSDDLFVGRLVSVAVGALALVGAFEYGRRRFSPATGLLASALLALSPFYLAFARVAFTESDIYLAAAFIWLLVALERLTRTPNLANATFAGVIWGLSLGAKATAIITLPILWLALLEIDTARLAPNRWLPPCNLLLGMILGVLGGVVLSARAHGVEALNPGLYLVALVAWLFAVGLGIFRRNAQASRLALAFYSSAVGAFTFLIFPPEHLLNVGIFNSLAERSSDEMAISTMLSTVLFHLAVLFYKSGPVWGAVMIGALPIALWRCRRNTGLRVPLAFAGIYLAGLSLLPNAQPYYSIPILPVLAVLAAEMLVHACSGPKFGALAVATLAAIAVSLPVEFMRCYPDYHLNGYQWLGESRLMGRPSVGYRQIVQTPSDGVEQAIRWLDAHARDGERVVGYFGETHIRDALASHARYRFESGADTDAEGRLHHPPEYIVFHINALRGDWLPGGPTGYYQMNLDLSWMAANYVKVFAVERRFGLEMASVWKRNEGVALPGNPKGSSPWWTSSL